MKLTRKVPIVLLMMTFVALLVWMVLREQPASFQLPGTPTALPPKTPTAVPATGLVLNIPQKALWKNYVEVSAEANPGTTCKLMYVPPSSSGKTHQTDAIANSNGLCVWKWKVDETEGKGNARLIFTIGDISETHFIEIRSSF